MKLVTFEIAGQVRHIGAITDDGMSVVDFTAGSSLPHFASMLGLIDGGGEALEQASALFKRAENVLSLTQIRLLAPLPRPRQMRDFLAFEKHLRQARANRHLIGLGEKKNPADVEVPAVWYEQPLYYKCNRFSVVGPDTDVVWPSYSDVMDYELEFGFVTSACGKDISAQDARKHIFGYCIFNDFSARDAQIREMQGQTGPAKGKDFDTGNVLGPWLVTTDEIPDPYALTMVARVNGEEWSRGSSGEIHHRFEDMIAHVSKSETIYPGEFFGSGTVGSGCGMELGRFLKAGDIVELEVKGLGILRNRVTR